MNIHAVYISFMKMAPVVMVTRPKNTKKTKTKNNIGEFKTLLFLILETLSNFQLFGTCSYMPDF